MSAAPEASSVWFVQLEQGNDVYEEGEDSVTESRDREAFLFHLLSVLFIGCYSVA